VILLLRMRKKRKANKSTRILSALLMLLALSWLTVSLPFINEQLQAEGTQLSASELTGTDEDASNPLSGTTEEKTPGGPNTLSEYLHTIHLSEYQAEELGVDHKIHPSALYAAFHPELISPPPEA
jgi:hypothetical protein